MSKNAEVNAYIEKYGLNDGEDLDRFAAFQQFLAFNPTYRTFQTPERDAELWADVEERGGTLSISSLQISFTRLRPNWQPVREAPAPLAPPEPPFTLTREEYYSLPASDTARKYRADTPKGFRAAVDSLIARKLI